MWVKARPVLHVRRGDQPAIEIIGPTVILAANAISQAANQVFDQLRSAVAADVEIDTQLA
jgi:hypothetical protein